MKIIDESNLQQVCGGDFASGEAAGEQAGQEAAKAFAADQVLVKALKWLGFFGE